MQLDSLRTRVDHRNRPRLVETDAAHDTPVHGALGKAGAEGFERANLRLGTLRIAATVYIASLRPPVADAGAVELRAGAVGGSAACWRQSRSQSPEYSQHIPVTRYTRASWRRDFK